MHEIRRGLSAAQSLAFCLQIFICNFANENKAEMSLIKIQRKLNVKKQIVGRKLVSQFL